MVQFDQSLDRQPISRSSETFIVNNSKRIGLTDEGVGISFAKSTSKIQIFEIKESSFISEHHNFRLLFCPSCSLSPAPCQSLHKYRRMIRLLHEQRKSWKKNQKLNKQKSQEPK